MERVPAVEQVNIDGGKFIREAKVSFSFLQTKNFVFNVFQNLISVTHG